jgi:hypothetical protein
MFVKPLSRRHRQQVILRAARLPDINLRPIVPLFWSTSAASHVLSRYVNYLLTPSASGHGSTNVVTRTTLRPSAYVFAHSEFHCSIQVQQARPTLIRE